jgi:TonB family protein
MRRARAAAAASAALAAILAGARLLGSPGAQTRGATLLEEKKPVYPETMSRALRQGNVIILGRIDREGRPLGLQAITASHQDFVQPALDAVSQWRFRPALRDGAPIEVFLNVGVRFRLEGDRRGEIGLPVLGDLAVSPADGDGKRTAPEGFPLRRGKDAAVRAEASLDVPPKEEPRTLTVRVEAVSPRQRHIPIYQPPVAVPAKATEVRFPIVARIGPDWEDGVWLLHVVVDGQGAGGGQFWLAEDPSKYEFRIPSLSP